MTQQERNLFDSKMSVTNSRNQTDFFLSVLQSKPIIVINDLTTTLSELKRHGNNLNQISRKLHEFGVVDGDFETVVQDCWRAYDTLITLEQRLQDALTQNEI